MMMRKALSMSQTPDPDEQLPEPTNLRFLRLLVTVLTGVMIAGLLAILAMIVIQYRTTRVPLPEIITLPDGTKPTIDRDFVICNLTAPSGLSAADDEEEEAAADA